MSKTLRFFGASDDLFECEGAIREEIGCFNSLGVYHLRSNEGELLVTASYTDEGCWAIGIGPVEDGVTIPAWPASFSTAHTYSAMLTLEVPDDTYLALADRDND
ncbi:hypothetical protein [Serratia sp. JSRIV002]|uniref:hypothetical protein n=1 Tax=Serratia sp. JSRIV002 TaxID=2831894 RepID=UPI001CBAF6E6|nr:hypothetical protein [Serratia sp. JSRIV002]